ncbi:MAG: eukaryotic-like serine/threonine-protein kinase, partial [Actinomycetota bacterium]|nr:eukaryotic-like serine/threonine-protein kinase [Actinomycetota bacterium]
MTLVASRLRAAGTMVGPFRLERGLGGGHDTEVWRANGDGIIVALKLLRPGADALARARLAREAAVLTSIDHPAIGWLLDSGEEDGEPYLAFTLYEAGTLAARIDRGRLGAAEAAAALAPVADALAYVHERGIVHRDVKPANVLCAPGGPVLVDFSIASITGSTYDGWIDGAPAVAGTEGYRAPEAGVAAPSAAEDVYALGVSIVEALTGSRSGAAIDDVPGSEPLGPLTSIVSACLALDATARPSAAAVASALRDVAGDTPPPVEPAPSEHADLTVSPPVTERYAARADEVARLVASVEDGVAADEMRAVVVVAPAGAGKTWLIEHAVARVMSMSARGTERRVLSARCNEAVGDASVLRPWLRPLLDREGDAVASLARVVGRAPAMQVARAFGFVRGGGVDGDTGVVADALASLLASMGVVVCIVEDLHHASLELLDLLARLSQRSGVAGALWCTTRPGFVDPDDLDFATLPLVPLDDDTIVAVVADAIGESAGSVVAQVVAVAGGNPLYAREAALAAQRGDGTALSSLGSLPDLIADRFAHLDGTARHAVEVAAACGDSFWPEAVGGDLLTATPALYQTGVAQVRMTSSILGSTEAGWSHPLLQEVAYSSMSVGRRRELHASLGLTLERADAGAEVVARQAGLAFRLGDVGSAALAGRSAASAARDALDRFALSGADSWISLLRDSGHEPVAGSADVLDAELRIARGDFDAAARLVRPLTTRADDIGSRALVLATEATAGAGDLRAAEQFGEAAHARLGDDPQLAASFGAVLARRGRLEDALRLLDVSAETSRAAGDDPMAARLAAQAADVAADLAEASALPFADAITRTRTALAALRETGDRRR